MTIRICSLCGIPYGTWDTEKTHNYDNCVAQIEKRRESLIDNLSQTQVALKKAKDIQSMSWWREDNGNN